MIGIENYAYNNRWRSIHPRTKIIFAIITMLMCISSRQLLLPMLVVGVMVFLTIERAQIPLRFYWRLCLIPAGFIVVGALTVSFGFASQHAQYIWYLKIGAYYLGVTAKGISDAMFLLARACGALTCLFFLALTTPMEDIAWQLEQWKVPYIMIEMMILTYRFIFVFWEEAVTIHISQAARLGHINIRAGFRSLSYLISSVFLGAFKHSEALYSALVSRGYTDSLRVLTDDYCKTPTYITGSFVVFDSLLLAMIILQGRVGF